MDTRTLRMREIRRQLKRRGVNTREVTRREDAVFNEANDHNPLVYQVCRTCRGRLTQCLHDESGSVYRTVACTECGETGLSGEVERFFTGARATSPPLSAVAGESGYLRCPGCGSSFSIRDRSAWTGLRHNERGGTRGLCGQRLLVRASAP